MMKAAAGIQTLTILDACVWGPVLQVGACHNCDGSVIHGHMTCMLALYRLEHLNYLYINSLEQDQSVPSSRY